MSTKKLTPAAAPRMKRHNVFMPQAYLDGLEQVAKKKGITSADVLRAAVSTHLKRHGLSV